MASMDAARTPVRTLKACLNGKRTRAEHPAVPVTPAELASSAAAAVAAGAEAVHLHARNPAGTESVQAADVGAAVAAVRQACPDTPVGVSTGLWITGGDPAARQAERSGLGRPDRRGTPRLRLRQHLRGGLGRSGPHPGRHRDRDRGRGLVGS